MTAHFASRNGWATVPSLSHKLSQRKNAVPVGTSSQFGTVGTNGTGNIETLQGGGRARPRAHVSISKNPVPLSQVMKKC